MGKERERGEDETGLGVPHGFYGRLLHRFLLLSTCSSESVFLSLSTRRNDTDEKSHRISALLCAVFRVDSLESMLSVLQDLLEQNSRSLFRFGWIISGSPANFSLFERYP